MSTIVTTIDPERQMLGEVEMVGRERWEEIHRRAWSPRTRALPRCAGTHSRADCAARPARISLHTEEPSSDPT